MCNLYEYFLVKDAYNTMMRDLDWGIPTQQDDLDFGAKREIKIRDQAPVMRLAGNGVELAQMHWAFPPKFKGGKPAFNFRSEGRSFKGSNRCLIPASAFFEFTGGKSPKTKHRFTLKDAPFLCIAGIWRESPTGDLPDFTMLTVEPGPDVAPYHDRQIAVLKPAEWPQWLYLTKPEAELLRPLPAGTLVAETVRGGGPPVTPDLL